MILPKKLIPVTERELLDEVAEELQLDIVDVNRTYEIWLKFLRFITEETDQCTVKIPHLGQMYVSLARLRKDERSKKYKEMNKRKKIEIEKLRDNCKYIVHEKSTPIILKYGLGKRKPVKKEGEVPDFYTARELIDNQNRNFFKEDFEFSEKTKYEKYFFDD